MKKISSYALAKVFGVSPSCLYYWEKTHLIKRSIEEKNRHFFGFKDIVAVKTIIDLKKQGLSLQRIRQILGEIKRKLPHKFSLSEAKLMVKGKRIQICLQGVKFDPYGQLYLDFRSPPSKTLPFDKHISAQEWFRRGCRLDDSPQTLSQAEEAYLEALKLDNNFTQAMINMGNVYYLQGKTHQATMWYKLVLKKAPDSAEAHFNYANLLEDNDQLEEALSHYQMATILKEDFAEAHYNLALVYEKLGQSLKAYKHWSAYLKYSSDKRQKIKVRKYLEKKRGNFPPIDKT
jgi:tetratricopeptide (TPR) repeat protein